MKKKTVTIVMIVVAILIVVAVCIGLKSCSSLKDGGNGGTEVGKDGVVITNEDEKDEADKPDEENTDEIVTDDTADDIADWGDATEGIVDEDKTTTSEDKISTDKTTTDKKNEDKDTADKDTADKDTTDSDNAESNTKKQYTITYNVNNANATIDASTQKVTFGEAFTLATPKLKGGDDYRFVKWVITGTNTEFKSGIYDVKGNVSLSAIWEDNYSKNY